MLSWYVIITRFCISDTTVARIFSTVVIVIVEEEVEEEEEEEVAVRGSGCGWAGWV